MKTTMYFCTFSEETLKNALFVQKKGNVITALHRGSQDIYNGTNGGYNDTQSVQKSIPWKDNILTQTLHSLCTSQTPSKMLLFLNCSLKSYLYEETLATLRFGNLAMTDPMLLNVMDNYRKKIKSLHSKISKYKHKSQNDTASIQSGKSISTNDSLYEEKLKSELDKVRRENRKILKELNSLKLSQTQLIEENNKNQSIIDYQRAQFANMELGVIQIKDELLRSQTNEQLLRDENEDLQHKLSEINSMKQNKLQYIDNNLMKRASIIHSTLKRNMMNQKNDEQSKMIDELSQQIESLENLKAELKYEIQQKDDKINQFKTTQKAEHRELESLRQEILNYKTNYILKTQSDIEINQLLEQIKERDCRIHEYERDIKENLLLLELPK